MHYRSPSPTLVSAAIPLGLLCAGALISGCGNSNTGPMHSDAPLAPTPHVAGDPPPRTLRPPIAGALEVNAVQIVAEVTAVDVAKRVITFKLPDGKTEEIKAAKEMPNFDKVHVGDRVAARVSVETALFVRRDGEPPSTQEADILGVRVRGDRPAAVQSEAVEVTATVVSVDEKNQKLKLLFAGGREATVDVHHAIDLSTVKPGDDIIARVSERLMFDVVKQ